MPFSSTPPSPSQEMLMKRASSESSLQRSKSDGKSRSMSNLARTSGDLLQEAQVLTESAEKLVQSRKSDDALQMFERSIEIYLEVAKNEIEMARIIKCHFTVANLARRYAALLKVRESGEWDLAEMLSSSPITDSIHYTMETMASELFLLKIQIKMKLSGELNKTHRYKSKSYPSSFTGSDAVLWLMRNEIVVTREEAVNVGQNLVDACMIAHVDVDQPFQDGSSVYRFVELELYHLQLALRNPNTGLPSLRPSDGNHTPQRKTKSKKFSGKELCDWLMLFEPLNLMERHEAVRLGQRLIDNFHIKNPDKEKGKMVIEDSDDQVYCMTREDNSVMSLHSATKKGPLSLLTENKWKSRYFVFVPTQQLLYFFDAEDSSTPKGIINLRNLTVHAVDDSMFNKKSCFQIVTPERSYALAAASDSDREEWMNALLVLQGEAKDQDSRQISSFRILVDEAQDLPTNNEKNYYCVLFLGNSTSGVPVAKTQVQWRSKNGVANWNEDFLIDDFPPSISEITVAVFSRKSSVFDQSNLGLEIGTATIKLESLSSHAEMSQWFSLSGGAGRLQLRFTLEEELILPLKVYQNLLDYASHNFALPEVLLQLTSSLDREQFSQTVLRILESKGKALEFLLFLVRKEVAGIGESTVLFRVNTVVTKAVVEYMKMIGQSYLSDTLHAPLRAIAHSNLKMDEGGPALTPEIETGLNALIECIFLSANRVPLQLKRLFSEIRKISAQRFPDEPNVGYLSVTGFLFLRLICPAIISPSVFGIMDDVPDADSARVLKSLARYIQSLANLKINVTGEFQADQNLKTFLEGNLEKMKAFVDRISVVPEDTYFPSMSDSIDLERELAIFYHYLVDQSNEIMEKSEQSTRDALSDLLDEVSAVYEEKWPNRSTPYQYKISLAKAAMFLS